jgi:hypothetical protein
MEPEMSQGVDDPSSGQGAGLAEGRDAPPAHTGAPRDPHVTQTLEPDTTLTGGDGATPPAVKQSAWLKDDDYWRNVTYMSATGRHPASRPATRPLPRPDRFPTPSRLRSGVVLILVIALIILVPVGVVMAGNAASHFTIPGNIPGISPPTVTSTPIPTHAPTATPKKKR